MECSNHPLNNLDDYPLVIYGENKKDTIALYGGLDYMPTNHLLGEIAALLPVPHGVPTDKPMVIYAAGEEDQPPGLPRKSRKETRETNPDHALPLTEGNQDDLETTRPTLTPSAQHRRNPSRRRKGIYKSQKP